MVIDQEKENFKQIYVCCQHGIFKAKSQRSVLQTCQWQGVIIVSHIHIHILENHAQEAEKNKWCHFYSLYSH